MDLFNTPSTIQSQPPQYGQNQFGGFSSAPQQAASSGFNGNGFGGGATQPQGYSLSAQPPLQPSQASQQNRNTNPQQQQQQQKKPDAFADLVDLMS
jgi:hypothetical protein